MPRKKQDKIKKSSSQKPKKKKYPIELKHPLTRHYIDWDDPAEFIISHYDYDFIWIFKINKAEGVGQAFEGRPAKGLSRETRYELTNQ